MRQRVGSKMMVEMTDMQLERLIAAVRGGGGGGAARGAAVVGPMGPCGLGKDKLKRPKRLTDWKKRTPTIHDDKTIISAGNGPMRSQVKDMNQWEDRDWEMDQSESCTPHLS